MAGLAILAEQGGCGGHGARHQIGVASDHVEILRGKHRHPIGPCSGRGDNVGGHGLLLIATQQPMARDLRLIAAIMEIVGELERIHDYIKGIGKISLSVGAAPILPTIAAHMPEMGEQAREMLHLSLKAFAERDKELALRVPAMGDKVDFLFNHLYSNVVAYVMEHPLETAHANHLEWALHNLGRSADRTINICEWVVYMITGVCREMSMG